MSDARHSDSVSARLLSDHRDLEELLERVLAACESDDCQQVAEVWTEFDRRLLKHMAAEEQFLLPILRRENERAFRAILEEHRHFRKRLVELCTEVDLHTIRLHEARAFVDELRAHAAHEKRALYSLDETRLGETERASVLEALSGYSPFTPRTRPSGM